MDSDARSQIMNNTATKLQQPNVCNQTKQWTGRLLLLPLLFVTACSVFQPADTDGPRASERNYPVVFNADPLRREATLAAINQFIANKSASQTQVVLHPITATIVSLPANTNLPLYLPRVGTGALMSDEETRESLRRFINDWRNVIGAEPSQLSLVNQVNEPNGIKQVDYEQRPFRYPLRGEFGKLHIRFAPDRRLLNISSTCIPDAERLQAAIASITPAVKPEDAVKYIQDHGATYTDVNGRPQTVKPLSNSVEVRELVVYVSPAQGSLQFHLAWEIKISNAPIKTVYLDAVDSKVLGTT
jgi:hypothetical protein